MLSNQPQSALRISPPVPSDRARCGPCEHPFTTGSPVGERTQIMSSSTHRRTGTWLLLAALLFAFAPGTVSASFSLDFTSGNITHTTSANGADYSVTVYGNADSGYGSLGANEVVFVFRVAAA